MNKFLDFIFVIFITIMVVLFTGLVVFLLSSLFIKFI